ncbi:hypothetical protein LCGC14_2875690, partial [marine sediment metagenome]
GEAWQIDQGYELYYECRFTRTDADISCFVGLSASDASAIAGLVNGIGFKTVAAVLNTVCDNAGSTENVDAIAGVTIAALTWDRVAIHYDGVDTVKFYHAQGDDEFVLVNTLLLSTTTDYVPQDLMMTPTLEAEEQTAAGAGSMYVDYVLVQQRRCRLAE